MTQHAPRAAAERSLEDRRAALLERHRQARARRAAAELGSAEYRRAALDLAEIEADISALEPVGPLPRP